MKRRLNKKELTIGSWITIGHPTVAEIMAKSGFDWLVVDMEHSALSMSQCQELIRVIDLCRVVPFVRVAANDALLIKQAMDAGAHGVIVPMVNTSEDARKAVSAVKYPPVGTRGVGLARAQGYGTTFREYQEWVEKESMVIVQIETKEAVKNLEDILSVKGVDAFMVGPYDLSGSLGVTGDFESKIMLATIKEINDLAKKKNVSYGYHVVSSDPKFVWKKIKEGCTFIAFGVDFLFLVDNCREGMKRLHESKT